VRNVLLWLANTEYFPRPAIHAKSGAYAYATSGRSRSSS